MIFYMNKILTILITVAGVAIVWTLIIPMIQNGFGAGDCDATVIINNADGYTFFDYADGVACVQVRRLSEGSNLSRIDVLFVYNGTTLEDRGNFSGEEIPQTNEAKTKCFNLTIYSDGVGGYDAPDSIKILPIYLDGAGEVEGEVISTVGGDGSGDDSYSSGNFPDGGSADPIGTKVCEGGCDDGNDCTDDVCLEGVCSYSNKAEGDSCSSGGECYEGTCYTELLRSCATLSVENGKYLLRQLVYGDSGTCFSIEADGIDFDLGGNSVYGPNDQTGIGVSINADDVEIHNAGVTNPSGGGSGGIVYFNYGIAIGAETSGGVIRDVRACDSQNGYDISCGNNGEGYSGEGNNFDPAKTSACDNSWPRLDKRQYAPCVAPV